MISPRIGVVTGIMAEAVVVSALAGKDDPAVRVACAGASSERASALARELVDAGVEALLSFGIAGALAPELDCGDLLLAETVHEPQGKTYPCDAGWHGALAARLKNAGLPHRSGPLLASRRVLCTAADKQAAHRNSRCLAVDMESGAVAAVAAAAGLRFLAVRAVADRAQDTLPALVENAIKPNGMPAVTRTLGALLRHPSQLPATRRMARQSDQALVCLRQLEPVKDALLGGF